MSDDHRADTGQQGTRFEGIQPDAWRFDLQTPIGVLEKAFLSHPKEQHEDEWIKGTEECLFAAETIQEIADRCDSLEELKEVFSSDE